MKIAYLDCFAGTSGDMILGALVDAGLGLETLETELAKLGLEGYRLETEQVKRHGITGTKLDVHVEERGVERKLADILDIIEASELDGAVKDKASEVFKHLAVAEAHIHDRSPTDIHFHEVGGMDAIIDVVGAVAGFHALKVEAVYSGNPSLGTGFVKCGHGTLPLPAPATLELLKGVQVRHSGIPAELTTPTGAALMTTLAEDFGPMPKMTVQNIGYGGGARELEERPNLLRLVIGELEGPGGEGYERDEVLQIETNIDDMNPEFFGHVCETLLSKGALDVYTTPVHMKKSRPGTLLTVVTGREEFDEILSTIFKETTTFGVRVNRLERRKLARRVVTVKTRFGEIRVKLGLLGGGVTTLAPEYEDCRKAAAEFGVSLKDVYELAKEAAWKLMDE